jgi:hypothetical protein
VSGTVLFDYLETVPGGIHAYKRSQEPFYLVTWKRYLTPLPGMDAAAIYQALVA